MDAVTNYFFHKWLKQIIKKKIKNQKEFYWKMELWLFRSLKKSRTLKYLYGWNIHNKLKNMHLG